jgi:FkbM family methyltransferase
MASNYHLNRLHRWLATSRLAVKGAVRLRNQCECVIGYRLGTSSESRSNGEMWLLQKCAPSAKVFVDVGANVGNWSAEFLRAATPTTHGILLEPAGQAFSKLSERFHDDSRTTLINAAASSSTGLLTLFEDPDAGETSSFVREHSDPRAASRLVQTVTLDEVTASHQIVQIDYLKIDAEGHDLHVLRGSIDLLKRSAVRVVQFEYNACWAQAGSTLADAIQLLHSVDYEVYLLRPEGLFKFDYGIYGEFYRYSNFVAIRRSDMAHFTSCVQTGL